MKNKEKYFDKIVEYYFTEQSRCVFIRAHILKRENCQGVICFDCLRKTKEWLEQEYIPKTKQTEFLKLFPNAQLIEKGILNIYPCDIDFSIHEKCSEDCDRCREEYWGEKIE